MSDLIDRQAAISAMEDVDWYHIDKDGQLVHGANSKEDEPLYKASDVYAVLNQMPSAQPIRCKDCRWRDDYGHWLGCPVLNTDDDNFCSYAERRTDEAD